MSAKTGNYPGVTVDRLAGRMRIGAEGKERDAELLDLPGVYSLDAISEDEAVTVRMLRGEMQDAPDAVLVVIDATSLERSLPLLAEVLASGRQTLLVLTMIDELRARGGSTDIFALRRELGIPVVGVVGNRGVGLDDLRARLGEVESWERAEVPPPAEDAAARFAWSDGVLERAGRQAPHPGTWTRRLDAVLLHKVAGPAVFLAFITLFFQAIFSGATPMMDALDEGISALADFASGGLGEGLLASFVCDGVIRGVGAVLVFLPQIMLLFAMIFFLEASGYMARASFVVDRLMGWVGLEGRCFVALLSSYACAVPGIMATRSIPSARDRLVTILIAPITTCGARLPVYALLITAFVEDTPVFGPFTMQGLTLFALYMLGALSALAGAAILKRSLVRGRSLPFYQELPPYRWPSMRAVAQQIWQRMRIFLKRAGTVILGASIILWVLLNFPRQEVPAGTSDSRAQQIVLENSYAARVGKAIEPIFEPMGFDWRVNVGLLGSFAAREVMVSTLAQVYGRGGEATEDDEGLIDRVRAQISRPSAFALLIWFVYALQCISTIAVIRRETNSWRWPLFALGTLTGIAWVGGWITFRFFA